MIEYNIEQGIRLTRTSHLSFQFTRLCDPFSFTLAKAKLKLHCYLGHQERRECQSGFNGLTSIVLRTLLFPVPECCNIALRVNRQNYIQATLHCRIGNKCNFSGSPFRPGDQSIFGLASFNFNSDPTCCAFRCVRFTGAN